MAKVSFCGLGVMGYPMAGHLAAKGHDVVAYNRNGAKSAAWAAEHRGSTATSPRAAAEGAEVVFMCVGNDDDVRQVALGADGILSGLASGSVLVDHTTASADVARELDRACRAHGVGFIDAPVSGGQAGAVNGVLTVMCGGAAADFERVKPIIAAYARACELLGPSGAGQLAKMVNQICIAGIVQGLAEGVNFAQRAGLDVEQLIAVISKGAAQSWQMENRAHTMARSEFDFGFAVEWMRKDLGIVLDESNRNGARVPLTALVDQFYAQVVERGGRRWDTSSLIDLLQRP
jgi:6-phosphogluconate dehydrogenase